MYMYVPRGLSIRILDSVNFLPMKLAKLPEAFGLRELKKGFFPHFFNRKENVPYSGPYPLVQFYAPDYMNPSERAEFLAWYNEKVQCGTHFDFQREILEYCQSEVDILSKACLKFREIILNLTGKEEGFYDENAGAPDTRIHGGVVPFSQITIASVCMKILRTKFLEETWEIKLRNDSDVSDWLPAKFKDGTMSTIIDGVNMSGEELQQNGYVIEEKKFDSTPIAQVPAYGYNRDTFSMASIKWLEWYSFDQKSKGKQMQICHVLNGGEKVIPNTNYRVDEHISASKVSDFYGCFWHGCKICYSNQR